MNLKLTIIQISFLMMIVLCTSCVRSNAAGQSGDGAHYLTDCPVYETRNWHAWIDQLDRSAGTGRLNISGQIELPSPGFTIDYSIGPLDRRNPPSLRIKLLLTPPEGSVIQVIKSETLRHSIETTVLRYRSIFVMCGDRQLAEMVDVIPSE